MIVIPAIWASIILTVTFADGDIIHLPFEALAVCEEVRAAYLGRPEVLAVSACQK